ncbi:MAG TPA: molybdenum cofactor biosynthesis protein MoaE [Rhizomicrobium sp.]|jgi:molybdopterin synthase catalytic subunit
MITIRVQSDDFDVGVECESLTRHQGETGALVTFTGLVRGDGKLRALRLEHYPGMTEREIALITSEAESRWPLQGITIIHRVGELAPGARIVLVAVAAAHRAAAFAAAQFLMDYLKTRAPFWKEEFRGADSRWVAPNSGDDEAALKWR